MFKYEALQMFLEGSEKLIETLSFQEVEDIIEDSLPESASEHREWWANGGHTQAAAWLDVGWKVESVSLGVSVTFRKAMRSKALPKQIEMDGLKFEVTEATEEGKRCLIVIGYGVSGAKNRAELVIPAYLSGHQMELVSLGLDNEKLPIIGIAKEAFKGRKNLTSVSIPDRITYIDREAFSGCENLTSVTIRDSVIPIGEEAFCECTALTEVTIPNGVFSIGKRAFYECPSLAKVTIPDSVISIGEEAFCECTALTEVTIPNGVFSIGKRAFYERIASSKI